MWSNRNKNLSLNDFIQGSAKGKGDCFFDSIAQGLKQILQNQEFTIKSIREDCYHYVLDNADDIWNTNMSLKEIIAQDAFAGGYGKIDNSVEANFNNYLAGIRLTAEDVKTIGRKYTTIWGRPNIEGRIICRKYNLQLHTIEKHKIMEEEIWTNEITDGSGSKPCEVIDYNDDNIIHIINIGNNHFIPLLCKPQDELLSSHNQVTSSNEHSIIDQVQKTQYFS